MPSPGLLIETEISKGIREITQLLLPSMTTTERDNLTAINGMIIYNSTTTTVQVYQGGAWASV